MIVDPAIAALRSDHASQRQLRAQMDCALATWREQPDVRPILADISGFAEGQELNELSGLANLMTSLRDARNFVESWLAGFAQVLRCHPLAQIPMQSHHSDGLTTIQIASEGGVALSLTSFAARDVYLATESVVFSDRETHDLVLYGEGEASLHRVQDKGSVVTIETTPLSLSAGTAISCKGDRQTRQYERVRGRLVVLQLSRLPKAPKANREYALKNGQLLQQSSGDKRASQHEMAMAVLSAMSRADAAPVLADLAQVDGADHLRWEAVRHALSLDSGVGLELLTKIAGSQGDRLSSNASQLLLQLHAAYPELTERKAA